MSVLTYDNLSIKKYNRISKHKDREIEIVKMWYFITTTVPVIVEDLSMIK